MLHNNITNYIKHLTSKDKKTLSQKVLKVCEETGELAKVALPFDNAHATTHRFASKEDILEEVADIFLTSISVAYDLGFTDKDFEEMVNRKLRKWADLQQRQEVVQDEPIPFEIHITVENADKGSFIASCANIGVKPIILDLQSKDGKPVFDDVMTSSVHYGTNRTAFQEMERIANKLTEAGFNVIRRKIETVPWHPAAPSNKHINPQMKEGCYFETHIGVITTDGQLVDLEALCEEFDLHMSKNIFKRIDDRRYVVMLTYRKYSGTYERFSVGIGSILKMLEDNMFTYDKITTEFSIYDTKLSHDTRWLELE